MAGRPRSKRVEMAAAWERALAFEARKAAARAADQPASADPSDEPWVPGAAFADRDARHARIRAASRSDGDAAAG